MATLLADIEQIRDETIPNANTALRVGTALENIYNGTVLTPPQITVDQDDYNPAGLDTATHIRIDAGGGGGKRRIGGLQAPPAGDNRKVTFIVIDGVGGNDLEFQNNDAGSLAANRFLMESGNNQTYSPDGGTVSFWYDHITQRWRHIL
jgi:hypothetical protein